MPSPKFISKLLPVDINKLSLEEGIFNIINLGSALVSFIYLIVSFLIDYHTSVKIGAGVGCFVYGSFYLLSRLTGTFRFLVVP